MTTPVSSCGHRTTSLPRGKSLVAGLALVPIQLVVERVEPPKGPYRVVNPVLRWMVANAVASEDAAGNIKPDREKSADKIDGVAAWCDALFAWAGAEPAEKPFVSVYQTRGFIILGQETQ